MGWLTPKEYIIILFYSSVESQYFLVIVFVVVMIAVVVVFVLYNFISLHGFEDNQDFDDSDNDSRQIRKMGYETILLISLFCLILTYTTKRMAVTIFVSD